ncbi:MAG: nucleotide exchange factor GrpE [Calothrix sp. MO_167.B12]|nr:nucleotide exchange factor GrpE [Calothrix sp. MO_167.B12]
MSHEPGEATEVNQEMTSDSASQINANEFGDEATQPGGAQSEIGENTATPNVDNGVTSKSDNAVDSSASAAITAQIESLKAQLDERSSQYMRIAADFENYRKRTQKEKEELDVQVKRNTITELLAVVDNFERARAQIKPQNDGELNIHKSYQGVYKLLVDSLKRLGVSPMRPEGEPFDPNLHEAVMREPTDEHPEGTVLEELIRGYYLGDRVLRHAMVKVAAPPEDAPSVEEESQPAEDND